MNRDQKTNKTNKLTRCAFCKYYTGSSCIVTPNSQYCREAADEYYQYIRGTRPQASVKSFRKWDKR